jgi:hypothetical protein
VTKQARFSDEKMRLLRDLRPLAMTQAAFFSTLPSSNQRQSADALWRDGHGL